jgi:hypothetical protein
MKKESKLVKYLESIEVNSMSMTTLGPEELQNEMVQKFLLCFDEFKNVKKINVLKAPVYLGDINTGAPIEQDETNLGDKSKTKQYQAVSFSYDPNREFNIEFNEEIDLYSITLSIRIYDPEELNIFKLGAGTWVMPSLYNPVDFTPLREVRVIFSPEAIQDIFSLKNKEDVEKEVKKRLMKSFEDALDNGLKENVPYRRTLLFRVSSISVKDSVEKNNNKR